MTKIKKILIANRGEIACRVIKSAHELGISTVAVYSDIDQEAPHRWLADQSVAIGEPRAYLDSDTILKAAKQTNADAIHPGYGFLAENAAFSERVTAAGFIFIGPDAAAISLFGDKRSARGLAESVGVSVIPGAQSCDSVAEALQYAEKLGFPLLLKAAAGGGGKGMRRVDDASQLEDAFAAATREATASFADGRLLLERYIYPARHIEVQILADGKRAVAIGERECSLQRRYQKVLEEAPAISITQALRSELFLQAEKLLGAAKYEGAATVEFIVGPHDKLYFLEVNTRLQVEHPVTELTTGLDLVAEQIAIAEGGSVDHLIKIAEKIYGHSIEVRINAEDPYNNYLPQTGTLIALSWPNHPYVRIDSGVSEGQEIGADYDSMLAKIISWGATREQARRRLIAALEQTVILGVHNNVGFFCDLLRREFFLDGQTFTTTLENENFILPELPEEILAKVTAVAGQYASGTYDNHLSGRDSAQGGGAYQDSYSPWQRLQEFRVGRL